jgi:two-component system, OmpR family, response regulator
MERVLIIDDHIGLRELLEARTSGEGFEIDVVHEGTRGLERAPSGEHSLVMLD